MKQVFVDTGFLVASFDPRDGLHDRALVVGQSLGPVIQVTSEMVLVEFLGLFSAQSHRSSAVQFVDSIRSQPNVDVVRQPSQLFDRAFEFFRNRPDKEWSLTDCSSFFIMEDRGITDALAHDRHFEQAGYIALLRE